MTEKDFILSLLLGGSFLMSLGYLGMKLSKNEKKKENNKISKILHHKKPLILLLGDSITEYSFDTLYNGWGAKLADYYRLKADIINRGFSGYNSTYLCNILPFLYPLNSIEKPFLTVIMLGNNDSAIKEVKVQHVDIEEFSKNVENIIKYLLKLNSNMKIILMTPTPIDDIKYRNTCAQQGNQQLRSNSITEIYAEEIEKLSLKYHLPCVDLFHRMQDCENWEEYLRDGLHPAIKGNEFIFKQLQNTIKTKLPLYDINNNEIIKPFIPYWRTLDPNKPKEFLEKYILDYQN